ncbi:hypothetical protein B0O99DRAFT_592866 [Bisporella sp. PMI_857]|nr:hypothetical protein B0O99DRAFT_592866 [Bisporella sp. PMI_857]
MVKVDFTQDYYADLQVAPTADITEIKKQFKKLALAYHPDRNPGRETEVTAQFQKIQQAHEVLSDANERARYDAQRRPIGGGFQMGGNRRGNPWSNVSSQYPAPPKAPTAARANKAPPPSAGARRYQNFETPKQSAYQAAQEGPEARKRDYEAWENMRAGSRSSGAVPKASNRKENNYPPPPPRNQNGWDYPSSPQNPSSQSHQRAHSSGASNRKGGFMPNTPGGDESAAPKTNYFSARKSANPPPPPPRPAQAQARPVPPLRTEIPRTHISEDPQEQFRDKPDIRFDTRQSTPYATHGGEKFDPFENGGRGAKLNPYDTTNINRSKSTREAQFRPEKSGGSQNIPRAGSESSLHSARRPQSYGSQRTASKPAYTSPLGNYNTSSSSDDGPEIKARPKGKGINGRPYAKPRANKTSPQAPDPSPSSSPSVAQHVPNGSTSKHSRARSLLNENEDGGVPLTPFNPSGPAANADQPTATSPNGQPSMYAKSSFLDSSDSPPNRRTGQSPRLPRSQPSNRALGVGIRLKLPTVSEAISSGDLLDQSSAPRFRSGTARLSSWEEKHRSIFDFVGNNGNVRPTAPSGASATNLFPMEEHTFSVVDNLINNRIGRRSFVSKNGAAHILPDSPTTKREKPRSRNLFQDSAFGGSPAKKHKASNFAPSGNLVDASSPSVSANQSRYHANQVDDSYSFSIPVDESTFQQKSFARNSTENINTTFSPDEWNGKFEGNEYFRPEKKAPNMSHYGRSRTQSGSRSRGRSPTKARPMDPHYMQQPTVDSQASAESPKSAKFSPEEWAGTFREQTFMPVPPSSTKVPQRPVRKTTRGSIPKPTMGTAAIVISDDSDSENDKPVFTGRKKSANSYTSPLPPSPDAMDVDTPPVKSTTPPVQSVPQGLKTSPTKRAASHSESPIDEELKVNFADLSVKDLISSHLPTAPMAPKAPPPADISGRPTVEAYQEYVETFGQYMTSWDHFNTQFVLHMLARKNQNDGLGAARWSDEGLEDYRQGLRIDKAVYMHLSTAQEKHSESVKEYAIVKEKMKDRASGPPRKKQS